MPLPKGVSGNPTGSNSAAGRKMLRKIRTALNKGIDGLGDASRDGTTAMGELITVRLKEDVIGTLKALSSYMPKDLQIDVTHSNQAKLLTDDELADRIVILTKQATLNQQDSNTIDIDSSEIETIAKSKS